MKNVKFEFTITGFVIALVLIGMFTLVFSNLVGELQTEYNLEGNTSLGNYDNFTEIYSFTKDIQENATNIKQDVGFLDVIGGFFSQGYSALKLTYKSFGIYNGMLDQASKDVPQFAFIKDYIGLIILLALFLGVGVAVLVKMRI